MQVYSLTINNLMRAIVLIFLSTLGKNTIAQTKPEVVVMYLTSPGITTINFDTHQFLEYLKILTDKCESQFTNETIPREVWVLFTLHKTDKPNINVFSRPEYDKNKRELFLKDLQSIKPIYTKLVDFSFICGITVKGGINNDKEKFVPNFVSPDEVEKIALEKATLAGKYNLIKQWATHFAIPVLAALATAVDDKFAGVKAIGKILGTTDFNKKQDIIALTERNGHYWRAIVEMADGDQSILIDKVVMHLANGDFDYVLPYLEIIPLFSDKMSVGYYFINQINWRLKIFNSDLRSQIQQGIQYHDRKQYDKAIAQYKRILKQYPNSAGANYELYFSKHTQKKEPERNLSPPITTLITIGNETVSAIINESTSTDRSDWDLSKQIIYRCDPLFSSDAIASNGVEAYLLSRRTQLKSLVIDNPIKLVEYADIALDLKVYGFAAQLYWLIFTSVPEETYNNRNILAYFLYCLDKLGETELRKNFKEDFSNEFKKIAKERQEKMENDEFYQSFKNEK